MWKWECNKQQKRRKVFYINQYFNWTLKTHLPHYVIAKIVDSNSSIMHCDTLFFRVFPAEIFCYILQFDWFNDSECFWFAHEKLTMMNTENALNYRNGIEEQGKWYFMRRTIMKRAPSAAWINEKNFFLFAILARLIPIWIASAQHFVQQ